MTTFKLSKKELEQFNRDLQDCQAIIEDFERARQAGVPNMDVLVEKVVICQERIKKLKAAYAAREK
jgi:hypothetical protein